MRLNPSPCARQSLKHRNRPLSSSHPVMTSLSPNKCFSSSITDDAEEGDSASAAPAAAPAAAASSEGRSIRAYIGVEFKGVRSGIQRRRVLGSKAKDPGRRESPAKVLKDRRSPRQRGQRTRRPVAAVLVRHHRDVRRAYDPSRDLPRPLLRHERHRDVVRVERRLEDGPPRLRVRKTPRERVRLNLRVPLPSQLQRRRQLARVEPAPSRRRRDAEVIQQRHEVRVVHVVRDVRVAARRARRRERALDAVHQLHRLVRRRHRADERRDLESVPRPRVEDRRRLEALRVVHDDVRLGRGRRRRGEPARRRRRRR
eukprot:30920-Pelagococcus_subviridis.AAC.26